MPCENFEVVWSFATDVKVKMGFHLTILTALLLLHVTHCESAILTIIPESLNISSSNTGSSASVTLKCSPPKIFGYLFSLNINRKLNTNPTNETHFAVALPPNGTAWMVPSISDATASGSLTEGFIMVNMTRVSCNDAGTYRCKVNYRSQGSFDTQITVEDKKLTVQVLPGQITLTAYPQNIYELNATVEMTCNGQVGSTTNGTQISWVWEYQDYQGSTWNSYMTDSDIAPPTPSLPNNSCQNNQVSVLTRRLTQEDSMRTYRCYVHRNGQSFLEFAGMYQIGPIGSTDQSLSTDTGTTTGVAWWIIVVAVAGGVILCLVIGIVVFIKRRDQLSENKPRHDEEESKDDEYISDVPPSNVLPMTSYLHLDSVNKKISELGSDRESAVDASEGASSRSSVSSQGTKNA